MLLDGHSSKCMLFGDPAGHDKVRLYVAKTVAYRHNSQKLALNQTQDCLMSKVLVLVNIYILSFKLCHKIMI